MMEKNYAECVLPYKYQYKKIILSAEKVTRAKRLAEQISKEKVGESHHQRDSRSHFKRNLTGILGELAMEQYLNREGIVDWTVGNSRDYNHADLGKIGLDAGIKTVRYGSFPLVPKKPEYAEIILILVSENHLVLCGLARPETLRAYQSDELVKDKRILERGSKTGFYGFNALQAFDDYEELETLITLGF